MVPARPHRSRTLIAALVAALTLAAVLVAPGAASADPSVSAITAWTNPELDPTGSGGGVGVISQVECAGPTDCLATSTSGLTGRSTLLRLDADGWSTVPGEQPSTISAYDCPTAESCVGVSWAAGSVGQAFAHEQQPDGSFSRIPLPRPAGAETGPWLNSISCWAAGGCVAVGGFADAADSVTHPLVYLRTARGWTLVPQDRLAAIDGAELDDVSCPTARDCVAVGGRRTIVLQQADGTAGFAPGGELPDSTVYTDLRDLDCAAAWYCVAVGRVSADLDHDGALDGDRGVLLARVGQGPWTWTSASDIPLTPTLPDGSEIRNIVAVSCPPASSACVAVGYADTPITTLPVVMRREPSTGTWSALVGRAIVPDDPSVKFTIDTPYDVSCATRTTCVAVGGHTTISDTEGGRIYALVVTARF